MASSDLAPLPHDYNAHVLLHSRGLGCSPFARHYSGNHIRFLFLWVLRCFTSPGFASRQKPGCPEFIGTGFPIRVSRDQCSFDSSPGLIAAFHALHRLPVPRHPLYTLSIFAMPGTPVTDFVYSIFKDHYFLVEVSGLEPPTPCLQGRCSPN